MLIHFRGYRFFAAGSPALHPQRLFFLVGVSRAAVSVAVSTQSLFGMSELIRVGVNLSIPLNSSYLSCFLATEVLFQTTVAENCFREQLTMTARLF